MTILVIIIMIVIIIIRRSTIIMIIIIVIIPKTTIRRRRSAATDAGALGQAHHRLYGLRIGLGLRLVGLFWRVHSGLQGLWFGMFPPYTNSV